MEQKPIRVLQVVEGLNPGMGATAVAMNYQQYIDPERVVFDYMVHTLPDPDLEQKAAKLGSRVFRMPALTGKNMLAYRAALKGFFAAHPEYKIVHGHLPNAGAFYLEAARRAGVPYRILHSHNSMGAESAVKRARNAVLNRRAVKCANLYFACSQKAADYLFGSAGGKEIILIRNAVDTKRFVFRKAAREEMRRQLKLEGRFVVGHVGRFCPQKNHAFLLEVFGALCSQVENAALLLVGDGELLEQTRSRVKELGMEDRVIFAGLQEKVQYFLQAMDVFVLPSLFEGLPLVGVEAQASGLPCLFSDEITQEAKVTGHVAYLPLSAGPSQWAEEIALFRNGYQRVDCGGELRAAGFALEEEADKLARFYEKLYR